MCHRCKQFSSAFTQIRSWAAFKSPVRDAIHKLKYRHDIGLGEALSRHLIELYDILEWQVDMIVPLPLSKSRQQERGYNQASLLAWPLALAKKIPYKPNAVERIRHTLPQVGLSAKDRNENVKDAFLAKSYIVAGQKILVVDDVTTTGSTIQACCSALKTAGASQVYAMTIARSIFGDDLPPVIDNGKEDAQPIQTLY